jgi:peroxiredoxin/predicted 2-oxoglutarate/Fe(II)-dependent dioxygenase YbiX
VTQAGPPDYSTLYVGDPAPWFRQRCIGQPELFSFDMVAGRFVALCFYGAASDAAAADALALVQANRQQFDNANLAFFGVSTDAADEQDGRLAPTPGLRHFADADASVSRAYGVAPRTGATNLTSLRRFWYVLDPRLRVVAVFPLDPDGNKAALRFLITLPTPAIYGQDTHAPVLMIRDVFEPEFCQRLIGQHRATGGVDSPVLTEGKALTDHGFKRRRDCRITEPGLMEQTIARIFRRVAPEIRHAFQFNATRLERLIVACYDAAEQGRFGPHRDNTVAATGHRRFAVSINLNDDFDGGSLVFPEYGPRMFRPQPGGALVFSCSLLHAVTPMRSGRRYACLPFMYDDEAARHRRTQTAPTNANNVLF